MANSYTAALMVGQSQTFTVSLTNSSGVAVSPGTGNTFAVAGVPSCATAALSGSIVTVTAVTPGFASFTVTDSEGDTAATVVCNFTAVPVVVPNVIALTAGAVTGV